MNCLIGIEFNDFALIAADMIDQHSIMIMRDDDDKLFKISDNLVMAVTGEKGDTVQFAEYIAKNIQLYKMRNGYSLGVQSSAIFTRKQLAEALRSSDAYQVNLLLAGYDKLDGPSIYFIDYLASCIRIPYAVHGYGGMLSVSILDRFHRKDMSRTEAYELLTLCVKEIQKRLIISSSRFKVQIIDQNGIETLPDLCIKNI